MGEWTGVAIALVSSCLGGSAAAITRYLVGNADPITLAILRWGIGFACLLPVALTLGVRWPPRRDWLAVALLGICFFGIFFVLYNIAIGFTTAARASLALATLPLHTMVVGALLGIEPLTLRKTAGVCVAVLGVIAALATGLSAAPPGAWKGELITKHPYLPTEEQLEAMENFVDAMDLMDAGEKDEDGYEQPNHLLPGLRH